jgi:hypothetical protein
MDQDGSGWIGMDQDGSRRTTHLAFTAAGLGVDRERAGLLDRGDDGERFAMRAQRRLPDDLARILAEGTARHKQEQATRSNMLAHTALYGVQYSQTTAIASAWISSPAEFFIRRVQTNVAPLRLARRMLCFM